ncbi:MAG: hypothetical protein KBG48_09520 [Kofleriaceae bacterium]|jgi:hypothetical protein|nr:hypothetical protein [Kofleriaceae bacterium]MBP9167615.1 hypothetical protein [Kofleriaceae bacterium]MBP9856697.1 hypothetical protein [Kofleriaceae bacterium]
MPKPMLEKAFDVVSVAATDGGWAVKGRAHLDVSVGDVLATCALGDDSGGRVKVAGLETYGRRVELLSKMMTGSIVVVGVVREVPSALYLTTAKLTR